MTARAAAIFVLLAATVYGAPTPLETTQANVQFNLALSQYNNRKPADAEATLKKALKLVPEHPQANLLLGIILSQANRFKDALGPLKLAAKGLPDNVDAHNNLGVAHFQLESWGEAEAAFKRVTELGPGRADAWMNLGVLGLRQKRWKQAKEAFEKASALDAGNGRAWVGLAEAAENLGDKEGNLKALGKALELSPADTRLRLNLAQKLYRAERNDPAEAALLPLKGKGESEAEFLLGCISYKKGRFDESRERFEAALAARPDYPEARFNLAITLYDQGRYADALGQFEAVLKEHPKDEQAKSNLEITRKAAIRGQLKAGSEDFMQGDYLAALLKWRAALELENDNKVIKDLVETAQAQLKIQAAELAGKGELAMQAGKMDEAVQAWSQALERDPDNAEAKAGLDKVGGEAKKLAQITAKDFEARLAEGRYGQARELAKRLGSLDKKAGEKALKDWDGRSAKAASQLSKSAEELSRKGALHEAVAKLEQASALRRDDAGLQLQLNQAKVALRGELSRALASAKDAEAAKKQAQALKEYRRVLELDPSHAEARDAARRLAKAAKAKAADPAELDDWYYQGVYAYAAGDTDKAMGFWKKVLSSDPGHKLATEAVNRANKRLKALSGVK